MDAVVAAVAAELAQAPGRVFVGFSGGLDSTVLLHAAAAGRRDIVAVHVDHGIHPDSGRWSEHCAAVAAGIGVGIQVGRAVVAPGSGLEARARQARYRLLAALLDDPDDVLLLAHHRDDQAETGLLRLLQGRGLYGMPARRALAAGRLIRPLLALPRERLREYAQAHALSWIEDPANLDLGMDRNFLRRRVLPLLRERWPALDETLLDAMAAGRQADAIAAAALGAGRAATRLPVSLLTEAEDSGLTRLRLWLQGHGTLLPTRSALREFLHQVSTAARDRQPRLLLDDGTALVRYRNQVCLVAPAPPLAAAYSLSVPGRLSLPHGELRVEVAADGVQPVPPVSVRFRRGGERLRTGGHERSVKQLLRESGLAPWERATFPLVWDARGLLALPGLAGRDAGSGDGPRYRISWLPR